MTAGAAQLASRLVLDTAGASFPVFYLDNEIENRKMLAAPVLVGSNALLQDLQRIGKFTPPLLESAWGASRSSPRPSAAPTPWPSWAPTTSGWKRS